MYSDVKGTIFPLESVHHTFYTAEYFNKCTLNLLNKLYLLVNRPDKWRDAIKANRTTSTNPTDIVQDVIHSSNPGNHSKKTNSVDKKAEKPRNHFFPNTRIFSEQH